MNDAENAAQDRERVTVVLTPDAAGGLTRLRQRTRLSKTHLVNRGILLYDLVDRAGGEVFIRLPDGTDRQVTFL